MGRSGGWRIGRAIVTRGVGLVLVIAAVGLWVQLDGLVGRRGVLPAGDFLARVRRAYPDDALQLAPTLLWLAPTDTALHGLCAAATIIGLLLMIGTPFDGPLLLGGWAAWLSLVVAGQAFLGFQWDSLLVESLLVAAVVARWIPRDRDPPVWGAALVWLLVLRLMFFGGLVKLQSGDPTWRDGTALTYHYWTQPLPNPVSGLFTAAPVWFHQLGTFVTFLVELGVPVAVAVAMVVSALGGPSDVYVRRAAAASFTGLMAMLAFTGNYGYFQLLSVVLALSLVDDEGWMALASHLGLSIPASALSDPRPEAAWWDRHRFAPVGVALVALAGVYAAWGLGYRAEWMADVRGRVDPLRTVNSYGLFAVMTTERPEVQLEVTTDGETWTQWDLPWKPGDPGRAPRQVAPHMPRLDWQMWFAALGSYRSNPWILSLQDAVLRREPAVLALLGPDPTDGAELLAVRTVLWDYRPAAPGGDAYWERTRLGLYCPPAVRGE